MNQHERNTCAVRTMHTVPLPSHPLQCEVIMSMECISGLGLFGCYYSLLPHLGPGGVVISPPTNQTAAGGGNGGSGGGGGGGVSPAPAPGAPGGAGAPAASEPVGEGSGGGSGGGGGDKVLAPVLGGVLGGGYRGVVGEVYATVVPVAAAEP